MGKIARMSNSAVDVLETLYLQERNARRPVTKKQLVEEALELLMQTRFTTVSIPFKKQTSNKLETSAKPEVAPHLAASPPIINGGEDVIQNYEAPCVPRIPTQMEDLKIPTITGSIPEGLLFPKKLFRNGRTRLTVPCRNDYQDRLHRLFLLLNIQGPKITKYQLMEEALGLLFTEYKNQLPQIPARSKNPGTSNMGFWCEKGLSFRLTRFCRQELPTKLSKIQAIEEALALLFKKYKEVLSQETPTPYEKLRTIVEPTPSNFGKSRVFRKAIQLYCRESFFVKLGRVYEQEKQLRRVSKASLLDEALTLLLAQKPLEISSSTTTSDEDLNITVSLRCRTTTASQFDKLWKSPGNRFSKKELFEKALTLLFQKYDSGPA